MKVRVIRNFKLLFILALTVMMLFFAVAFLLSGKTLAFANGSLLTASTELFLPKSELEYKDLNSPIDVYHDDSVTAIVQSNPMEQSLTVYTDGKFTTITGTYNFSQIFNEFTALSQVRKHDQNTLLITNQALVSKISLSGEIKATEIADSNGNSIRGTYFDTNGSCLVIAYSTQAFIYFYQNGTFSMDTSRTIPNVKGNAPIAINDKGEIYYVNGEGKIYKTYTDKEIYEKIIEISPDTMIANDDYLYYVYNDEIYQLSLNVLNAQPKKLTVPENKDYDLGNLSNPISLSFNGNNLLITDDYLNAIQEFKIEDDKLIFTGFAIAKGKTAYNRISNTVIDVETFDDTVATLDANKLSIINADKGFNAYDKNNFKDYFKDDLGGELPTAFALGNDTALLSYKHNTSTSELRLLNLLDGNLSQSPIKVFDGNIIRDVCYQSGKYYVLADDGSNNCKIFISTESELSFGEPIISINYAVTQITVDVFGNVYLYDNSNLYKFSANDNDAIPCPSGIKKITTDLGGGVFALKDSTIIHLDNNGDWQEINLALTSIDHTATVKSFAMDYINKDVYLAYESEEFVYKTTELNNFAISSIDVPDTYVTTANTADFNDFKIYKPNDTANVYSINKTDVDFEYQTLVKESANYALITEIVETDAFGRELKFFALAGQNGVVLANQSECTQIAVQTFDAPEKAFVTTAVHTYFLPISTANDEYALIDNDKIRLEKNTQISPILAFEFLNNTYYFATVNVGGVDYTGYVPKNFTVEVLAENFDWQNYTERTVNETDVYQDVDLINVLGVLEQGQTVRILQKQGSAYKIAFQVDGGEWAVGYVNANSIQRPANVAIRNILIVLAVVACVCGTSSFFLLRRKK